MPENYLKRAISIEYRLELYPSHNLHASDTVQRRTMETYSAPRIIIVHSLRSFFTTILATKVIKSLTLLENCPYHMGNRRSRSKSEQHQTVLIAIVFAVAGGLVLITPASINFQLAIAQEEQGQQQQPSSTLNDTTSSLSSMTGSDSETSSSTSSAAATDNETGIGEPLPSPTEMNATMLRGEIGSIQSANQETFSWSTAGDWVMQLDGPITGRAEPQIESFNATINMVRLDGNVLHEHKIYNFNQSSVTQLGDDSTTFNGTMTLTLREGPVENVAGYIQLLGDSIAIWVDPRAVDNHFGPTPIHGMVLPEGDEE